MGCVDLVGFDGRHAFNFVAEAEKFVDDIRNILLYRDTGIPPMQTKEIEEIHGN